jgi:hypothetical protein
MKPTQEDDQSRDSLATPKKRERMNAVFKAGGLIDIYRPQTLEP